MSWRVSGTVLAFVAFFVLWIYLDLDTEDGYIGDPVSLLSIPLFVGGGYVIGQWLAVLLAFVPIPLAVPAGFQAGGETPLVVFMVFPVMPVGMVLILAGVAARRLFAKRSRPARA